MAGFAASAGSDRGLQVGPEPLGVLNAAPLIPGAAGSILQVDGQDPGRGVASVFCAFVFHVRSSKDFEQER